MRITPSHWETVKFYLPYIDLGPWVERDGKRERAIKITFDDFLQPAVEARRARKPYAPLIYDLPECEADLISTYHNLPNVHLGLSVFTRGYSSESDREVDIEHDDDEDNVSDDEIMMVLGYPFFPIVNWP